MTSFEILNTNLLMRSQSAQEAGGALADKMTGHGDLLKPTKNPQNVENKVTEVKMGYTASTKYDKIHFLKMRLIPSQMCLLVKDFKIKMTL